MRRQAGSTASPLLRLAALLSMTPPSSNPRRIPAVQSRKTLVTPFNHQPRVDLNPKNQPGWRPEELPVAPAAPSAWCQRSPARCSFLSWWLPIYSHHASRLCYQDCCSGPLVLLVAERSSNSSAVPQWSKCDIALARQHPPVGCSPSSRMPPPPIGVRCRVANPDQPGAIRSVAGHCYTLHPTP